LTIYFFYNDIFTSILEKDELNDKRIKFILRNEKGSLRISSSLIENLIFGEYIFLLDIIFSNLKLFDNEFILNCCVCYKYKKPLSNSELEKLISKYNISSDDECKVYLNDTDYLLIACKNENERYVNFLIENRIKLDDKNNILCEAYKHNNINIVKRLIDYGLHVEGGLYIESGYSIEGETPLTNACFLRNAAIIKLLLENDVDVNREIRKDIRNDNKNEKDNNDDDVNDDDINDDDVNDDDVNNYFDSDGDELPYLGFNVYYPLTIACEKNNEAIVKLLI